MSVRVLARGRSWRGTLGFGEFFDGDFARGGAAAGFEHLALGLEGLDGFEEGGLLGDFLAVVGIGREGGCELFFGGLGGDGV